MDTWYAYRTAWSARPWLLALAALAVALVVVGVVATVVGGRLAFVFVPGLAAGFVHHLLVRKELD